MKVMKRMRQLFPANCSLVSCQTPTAAEAQGLGEGSLHSHSIPRLLDACVHALLGTGPHRLLHG